MTPLGDICQTEKESEHYAVFGKEETDLISKMTEKIIITENELAEQMGVSHKVLCQRIASGEVPEPTYGGVRSRKKAWLIDVLKQAGVDKYEQSKQDIGNV